MFLNRLDLLWGRKMNDLSIADFRKEVIKFGIVSYSEQDKLYDIAKKCAKQIGVPAGAGAGLATAKAGAVVIAVVGAVPGAVVGFLGGLVLRTAACTAVNMKHRDALRQLAK
jgi:hypothetical protein